MMNMLIFIIVTEAILTQSTATVKHPRMRMRPFICFLLALLIVHGGAEEDHPTTQNAPAAAETWNGTGKDEKVGGLDSYVTGNADAKSAVILLSNVFGYKVVHLRQIADKVAAAGYYTVVPDFFHGDPYNEGANFTKWKRKHMPDKGITDAKAVIEALKAKGVTKIGGGGYCWGGKVVVDVSKEKDLIQAAVLLHPSDTTVDDIKAVETPMSILAAELDTLTPVSQIKEFEAALKEKPNVPSSVKIFPGVEHGWTVQYNDTNATAVNSAEEAFTDMLNWFATYPLADPSVGKGSHLPTHHFLLEIFIIALIIL